MKIALVSSVTAATGNATTAQRIAGHLRTLGHTVEVVDVACAELPVGIDAAIGIHAFRSRVVATASVPHVIILGGTDVNEDFRDEARLAMMRAACSSSAAVVAFTPGMRRDAIARFGAAHVDPRRCLVAPPSVSLPPADPSFDIRAAAGIAQDSRVFLMPTGLRRVKDPMFIVPEFSAWSASWDPAKPGRPHLVIVGPELEKESSDAVKAAAATMPGIHFLGSISPSCVAAALSQSFALVNSSISEGLPNASLEAMICGCPVIGRDNPSSVSLLGPNTGATSWSAAGLLYSTPRQFVERAASLIENPRLRQALVSNGRALCRDRFSPSAERRAYAKVIAMIDAQRRKVAFVASPEGQLYGYSSAGVSIDELCATQFTRLAEAEMTYLDNSGSALYSAEQVQAASAALLSSVFANPHSGAASDGVQRSAANSTATVVAEAREMVAGFLHTTLGTYSVVFTAGSTASIKAVGESFTWTRGASVLCYLHDSHTSCLGIREYAFAAGAAVESVDTDAEFLAIAERALAASPDAQHLLVIPAQCNFSGRIYDLAVLDKLRGLQESRGLTGERRRWRVLLDAAAFASHAPLDLSRIAADFVPLSFYKIFGYPTGLGALVVRNDAAKSLTAGKAYFGGGTVSACIQSKRYHVPREGVTERFEDGTQSFIEIASLKHGFAAIKKIGGIEAIDRHTCCLARMLAAKLSALRHGNGKPVCFVASCGETADKDDPSHRGPVVSFNVRKANGTWVGPSSVGTLAALAGIQLRTGCMCNPGACQRFLGLTPEAVIANAAAGKVCWSDDHDILSDRPTGAVRASIGYPCRFEDVDKLVGFISEYFLEPDAGAPFPQAPLNPPLPDSQKSALAVTRIVVYPVKSCSGFSPDSWELTPSGSLLYDREWAVVGADGKPLTQKSHPRLCLVVPTVDLGKRCLRLEAPGVQPLEVALPFTVPACPGPASADGLVLCGRVRPLAHEREEDKIAASAWFSSFLGVSCTWVRAAESGMPSEKKGNFQNTADLLLLGQSSFEEIEHRLPYEARSGVDILNFRPNIVIGGATSTPFGEDRWKSVQVGMHVLNAVQLCNRCVMTCVDRRTGTVSCEPLLSLSKWRTIDGGIMVGVLFNHAASAAPKPWSISRGDRVVVLEERPKEALPPPVAATTEIWETLEASQKKADQQHK